MTSLEKLRKSRYALLTGNVAGRIGGLACVFLATLVLARTGGPAVVGVFALLHVLPGLLAVVITSGLPVAVAYFLAGPHRDDRRLPLTLVAIALAGGGVGAILWIAATPLLQPLLFDDLSRSLVMLAGLAVITRLAVVMAKSCSQGSDDLAGSNRIIFVEELLFLPAYALLWIAGVDDYARVVVGLLLADVATSFLAWRRLIKRGFFVGASRPSMPLARRIASYGLRAQLGGVISQLNLRLDFIVINVIAGPAVLGIYAVASKFAELLRILGMALTYVLYPTFARDGRTNAIARARRLIPRAGGLTAGAAVPLLLTAGVVIPTVYGSAFEEAVNPARIILLGLALEGVAGVITPFLYGVGRPGLNSWGMAAGLVATLVLDVLLIPHYGAVGAAVASAVAYATSTLALVWLFSWVGRTERGPAYGGGTPARADA